MTFRQDVRNEHIGSTVEWGHGFVVKEARDVTIIDIDGREYIDFSSGWNVANVGWGRPEVKEAMIEQLEKTAFRPMWCSSEPEDKLAKKLTSLLPSPLEVCFKATGGTESNEIALLLARAYTGRPRVISFETEYHGGTYGSLSLSSSVTIKRKFGPMIPGFVQVPMPACFFEPCVAATTCPDRCLKEIKNHLDAGDVAAVITEAVATNPGVYMPNVSFFGELRRLCDVAQTLLIIDEIGTGFGRTGKMFAIEHFGLVPDIITFAKALSGGYAPIGATITTSAIADSGRGALDTPTFGWTPLSCAAALSNIEIIEKERLSEKAATTGNYIRNQLIEQLSGHPHVGAIRGIGLELAIDVVHPNGEKWYDGALEIVRTCEEKGLVVELTGSACAVLLMPPLVIGKRHVDVGLNILVEAFNALAT